MVELQELAALGAEATAIGYLREMMANRQLEVAVVELVITQPVLEDLAVPELSS
jgi:hypothetical protein